jgi:alpha-N-arabinofuranosidase
MAALTADRKSLTLAVVNPTESEQPIDVAFHGVTVQNKGRLWRIGSDDLAAANIPGKPPVVDIVESPLNQAPGHLMIPKFSISIYELPVQ